MTNASDIAVLVGTDIAFTRSAPIVIASYFVSFLGAWATLDILNRRTSEKGSRNIVLLVCAALSMGGVAIWSMHTVGNQAIVLHHNEAIFQIAYSPWYTALSFLLPVIILSMAFFGTTRYGTKGTFRGYLTLGTTGFCTGCAICGMHYSGDAGIANYKVHYHWQFIFAASVIAIGASTSSLWLFFAARANWTSSWWKRLCYAALLSLTVMGMHWVANAGTMYRFKLEGLQTGTNNSRHIAAIVAGVLAGVAATYLIVSISLAIKGKTQSVKRMRQICLAAVYFNEAHQLMLGTEEILPHEMVTSEYFKKEDEDFFGVGHPTFDWIFRASRSWKEMTGLKILGGMKAYLARRPGMRCSPGKARFVNLEQEDEQRSNHGNNSHGSSNSSSNSSYTEYGNNGNNYNGNNSDYGKAFKASFCVAAEALARQLRMNLKDLGPLYPDILNTGHFSSQMRYPFWHLGRDKSQDLEAQKSRIQFDGQLLFVVRHLNKQEATRMKGAYRFVDICQISAKLSGNIGVNERELVRFLSNMRDDQHEQSLDPGNYLGAFVVRPVVPSGWLVHVPETSQNLLPTVKLPDGDLDDDMWKFLSWIDGKTAEDILEWASSYGYTDLKEPLRDFVLRFQHALVQLSDLVKDAHFYQARFSAKRFHVPSNPESVYASKRAHVFVFHGIANPHDRFAKHTLIGTPLNFFRTRQLIYPDDRARFARIVMKEFGSFVEEAAQNRASKAARLVPGCDDGTELEGWGNGIAVSTSFHVETRQRDRDEDGESLEMGNLGPIAEAAATEETDTLTYVDKMWKLVETLKYRI